MVNSEQQDKMGNGKGFVAALDQSGGSSPKALAEYGVDENSYEGTDEMFDRIHQMRSRVIASPAFDGHKVIGAILFEQTMDRDIDGVNAASYLWERKSIVPFLKVDKGLADKDQGVQLMKPIDALDELLARARQHPIFGTKMRSVIHDADESGIAAIVDQQYEYALRILSAGLVPILEPEVDIASSSKAEAETMLAEKLQKGLGQIRDDQQVMFKISLPEQPDLYQSLIQEPKVLRVVALSGGYSRDEACAKLVHNHGLIASFSRALLEGLKASQSDEEFNATLSESVDKIYAASVDT